MRIVSDDTMIARGHILSAEQQRKMDAKRTHLIPKEGTIIIYNEHDVGRITGGFKMARRGCFKIIDTHSHPVFILAEECIRPGYYKTVTLYKNDFLHKIAEWVEVKQEYYHTESSMVVESLSWDELSLKNFEDGYYIAKEN